MLPVPRDTRFVYPALVRQPADNELTVGGYSVSFATPAVTGNIERDPVSTSSKAALGGTITWASKDVRQFAVTMDDVPQAILDADHVKGLLETEMAYRIDVALDEHCVAGIDALSPPSGSVGTSTIAKVRNAVAASRALGANPSVLLLNGEDAAALDLSTTGADDALVFATRDTGTSSPLWTLQIRESEAIEDPILLDPALIGPLHVATGTVLYDPYTGMKRNVVAVRVELDALFFGRDPRGAYVIA